MEKSTTLTRQPDARTEPYWTAVFTDPRGKVALQVNNWEGVYRWDTETLILH